jgi:hypothetical protein
MLYSHANEGVGFPKLADILDVEMEDQRCYVCLCINTGAVLQGLQLSVRVPQVSCAFPVPQSGDYVQTSKRYLLYI